MQRVKSVIRPCLLGMAIWGIMSCGNEEGQPVAKLPVNVSVLSLKSPGNVNSTSLEYTGTVTAGKTIDLSFQVGGTVTALPVKEGQFVNKGQLIGTVDETAYRSQYEAQQAQVKLAEENYRRIAEVFKKGSIAEIKMIEARSQYEQASAAAKATYQNIVHTKILSPQSGYIGSKRMEAGSTAGPGMPVVQLLDIGSVHVTVPVPEAEVSGYKKGAKATINIAALNNRSYSGIVDEVAVLATSGSPNYSVKIKVNNTDQSLKPGMIGTVRFETTTVSTDTTKMQHEMVVPAEAVQVDEAGHRFVYVADAEGKHAIRKMVNTGRLYKNGLEITSGLTGDEQVIVSGFHKVTDKSLIHIISQ